MALISNRQTTGQTWFMPPLPMRQLLTACIPAVDLLYQNTHLLVEANSVAMGLQLLDGSVFHVIIQYLEKCS